MQDGADERDALLLPAAGLGQELIDVSRDGFVEVVFVAVQPERDGVGVAVGKQAPALHVSQIFLQPAQRPRAIRPQAENVTADFAGLGSNPVRFWKQVGVEQADEMGKAVVVAVVRRGREQNDVAGGLRGEMFGELVTLGLGDFIAASGRALGVGAALVRLVDDDQIPPLLPDALAHVVLFGIVKRGDDLVGTLPGIRKLLLVHRCENHIERLAEPAKHFVLPLNRQG